MDGHDQLLLESALGVPFVLLFYDFVYLLRNNPYSLSTADRLPQLPTTQPCSADLCSFAAFLQRSAALQPD